MSDGGYSSASSLTCEPEPLSSERKKPWTPAASTSGTTASPLFLQFPSPQASPMSPLKQPSGAKNKGAKQEPGEVLPPKPPPLAEAKKRYADEAKWGPPPVVTTPQELNTTDGLSCNPQNMSCPAPDNKSQNSSQADPKADEKKKEGEGKEEGNKKKEGGDGSGADAAAPGAGGKQADGKEKKKKQGGISAAERDRKFHEAQEDAALAMPFTPLPVPQADTGDKRLYPIIVQLPTAVAPFSAPQKLDVKPKGDARKIPAQFAGYERDFSESVGVTKGLYNNIVAEGREQTTLAMQQLAEIQASAQASLDRSLALIDTQLEADRKKLYIGQQDAIHRLELIAETSRMLLRSAARSVMGTVASRKATMEGRTTNARKEAKAIREKLGGFKTSVTDSGKAASESFARLAKEPKPARLTGKDTSGEAYDPQASAAMNELPPMDPVIMARANNRKAAFENGVRVFGAQLDKAIENFGIGETRAFAPFQSYIDMLGKTAPGQIVQMRENGLKAIIRMEKRAQRTIKENANRTEIGLVEKHKAARTQAVAQAQTASIGQARGIERGLVGQTKGYAMLASSQAQAIAALQQQIGGQKGQQPEKFAQFASQAAKRTAITAQKTSVSRLAILALSAMKSRTALAQRATQSDKAQERSNEKLALQMQSLAEQAATTMMSNMLQQENGMRQSAEPIASSIDNYKIPAAAQADEMESALWVALLEAQKQANQAFYGGGKSGEGEGEGKSKDEAPPPGVGELPHQFVQNADVWQKTPETEDHLAGMTKSIGGIVWKDVTDRGDRLKRQMNRYNDPLKILDAVRGIKGLRAPAVIKYYAVELGGRDLIADGKFWMDNYNTFKAQSTLDYYMEAFENYLTGNIRKAVAADMQGAVNYSNNNEQLIAAAKALPPADMAAMQSDPKFAGIMNEVQGDLNDTHARALKILREATPENAADKVAAADAVLLTKDIQTTLENNPDQEKGADAVAAQMKAVQADVQGDVSKSALAGYDEFGLKLGLPPEQQVSKAGGPAALPDEYRFASDEEKKAATTKSWAKTVALLGTDGTAPTDGKTSGIDWLTKTIEQKRTYGSGEHTYEAGLRTEQIKLITEIAKTGPNDPRVKARQLIVEKTRPGGANQELVGSTLRDDAGNLGLRNPDELNGADAKKRKKIQEEKDDQKAAAEKREAEMYHFYDCFNKGIEDEDAIKKAPKTDVTAMKRQLGADLKKNSKDGREGDLMDRQVNFGLTDPKTAALAFEHAVDRAGTKEQLLKDTFGAMSKDQIEAAVAEYDKTHSPKLYERLGIFGKGQGFFDWPELSGDDAIDIQILAMGIPRNERERFQKSRMTSSLQMKNASDDGKALAGPEFTDLTDSHNKILKQAGVKDSDFNEFGELKRGTDGKYMGRWNSDGSFAPAARDGSANMKPGAIFDSIMFDAALASNEAKAELFKIAVDNIASSIVTAIIVATAIITTIVTFGGAASIWIPMAITAAGGLMAMSVNASLKGGRYGYEDALKDLGMTIVQTATAGLAAGLNIASTGGTAALKTALTSRMVMLSTTAAPKLFTQAVIGGATGAFGGAGNALFDDAAWDRGEWLSGIGHGAVKGFKSGFAGGAVTGGLMKGGQKFGQFLGMSRSFPRE